MIDLKKLKPQKRLKLVPGEILTIRGSYMSPNGLVITAKTDAGSIVDRNVPIDDIEEVIESGR